MGVLSLILLGILAGCLLIQLPYALVRNVYYKWVLKKVYDPRIDATWWHLLIYCLLGVLMVIWWL